MGTAPVSEETLSQAKDSVLTCLDEVSAPILKTLLNYALKRHVDERKRKGSNPRNRSDVTLFSTLSDSLDRAHATFTKDVLDRLRRASAHHSGSCSLEFGTEVCHKASYHELALEFCSKVADLPHTVGEPLMAINSYESYLLFEAGPEEVLHFISEERTADFWRSLCRAFVEAVHTPSGKVDSLRAHVEREYIQALERIEVPVPTSTDRGVRFVFESRPTLDAALIDAIQALQSEGKKTTKERTCEQAGYSAGGHAGQRLADLRTARVLDNKRDRGGYYLTEHGMQYRECLREAESN